VLLSRDGLAIPTCWTPDGKLLLYLGPYSDQTHVLQLPAPGDGVESKPRPLVRTSSGGTENDAQVSPDGRWVAYESNESGKFEVYVQPFPGGGKVPISTQGGQTPRWSSSGRELFYREPARNQLMAVDIRTSPAFVAGRPRALFELRTTTWDVAPDGKRFLVLRGPETPLPGVRLEVVVNWFEELRRRVPPGPK
jgi:Tol biopolymer transport system component